MVGDGAIADYTGYDPSVDPGISIEFSTAVFRFGHSLLNSTIQRLDENGDESAAGNMTLVEAFFAPFQLYDGGYDDVLRGLGDSTARELDNHIVEDVRSFLFAGPDGPGLDLATLNIQRGRDLGIATYNDLREALGLTRAETFDDVTSDPELAAQLQALYGDVDLLDAWVGGLAEDHVNGGLLGELFSTVMIDQFTRLRDGDPYWSEAGSLPDKEIDALWSTTLADIIERNSDIDVIQDNAFYAYDRIGGDDGDNQLEGGIGRDLLIGEAGNDTLTGNGGDDQLVGGDGDDTLIGGSGDNILEGGDGADTYAFMIGDTGNNIILDFGGDDQVDLTDFDTFLTFDDLAFSKEGKAAMLNLSDTLSVTFEGIKIDQLQADDFLLG